jgi:predicted nicotinamide N-methyase
MAPTDEAAFVRAHTALEPVPLVPDIRLHTATAIVPIWYASEAWLRARGVEVPFWSVPWAGGQALARWLLDHPAAVAGRSVVDFGTGSGLVAIAAKRAGASVVRAVDVDPLAIAACALNAAANDVTITATCEDIVERDVAEAILLAGDVWYELGASRRFEPWLRRLAASGVRVITGDPDRHYAPRPARELAVYDVPTSVDLESTPSRLTRVLEL